MYKIFRRLDYVYAYFITRIPFSLMLVDHGHKASNDFSFEDLVDEEMRLHTSELRSLEANAVLRVEVGKLDRVSFQFLTLYPFTHILIMHRLETI